MSINKNYLKLCSSQTDLIIIKPNDIDENFFIEGTVYYDSNDICWLALGTQGYTVTTSYSDWGTFTEHTNNDCNDCVQKHSNLIPKFPFIHELYYDKFAEVCLLGCPTTTTTTRDPFDCPPGVITRLPLSVFCQTLQNPSFFNKKDGFITIGIVGGSSPHTIIWKDQNGNVLKDFDPTLNNIGGGTFLAEVIDRYGDFKQTCECTIINPTDVELCLFIQPCNCNNSGCELQNIKSNSEGFFNDKLKFKVSTFGYIYFNNNKWEYATDLPDSPNPIVISTLDSQDDLPLGDNWVSSSPNSLGMISSNLQCEDQTICFSLENSANQTNIQQDKFENTFTIKKLNPKCIREGRPSYKIDNTNYTIAYVTNLNAWGLVNDITGLAEFSLFNSNFRLPVQNVENQFYFWEKIDTNSVLDIITLSGDCEITTYSPICMRIDCAEINFEPTKKYFLDEKPSWTSSTNSNLSIRYNESFNYWVLSGYTGPGTIRSLDNYDRNWGNLGGNKNVSVTPGVCNFLDVDFNITTKNPSCIDKEDGSIFIDLICPNSSVVYQYSVDGVMYSNNNFFSNLKANTYSVCVKTTDSNNNFDTFCKTIQILPGPDKKKYFVDIELGNVIELPAVLNQNNKSLIYSEKRPFQISIKDEDNNIINSLPNNCSINFKFLIENDYEQYGPQSPSSSNEYFLSNNNLTINVTDLITSSSTNTPNPNCTSNSITKFGEIRVYDILLTNNFSISGYVINKQTITKLPESNCSPTNQNIDKNSLKLSNITVNCECSQIEQLGNNEQWEFTIPIERLIQFAEVVGLSP
jgi:hypothetical protein